MLFNSIEFAIFLPIVLSIYWLIGSKKCQLQNTWLIITSYIFYGWWDYRFLSLIVFSSFIDFIVAKAINSNDKLNIKKTFLAISFITNLGLLGFFKYYDFFVENFVQAFTLFGKNLDSHNLNIILPVGISFYTFQTLSYTIDVYKGKIKATNNPLAFAAFVSFFPQLVAGPIERATSLVPQFTHSRKFHYPFAQDGMRQILWGLFKKIVIADNCAPYVNEIFENYDQYPPETLFLGAILFTFQIYGDFSGYSDIAIGCAKLFGFKLMTNFKLPYFSRDIAEFWRRWHISLSSWFKDYLYIPLGGSRVGPFRKIFNVFAIFIVSGFWHGANWTFIVWGAINALYFVPLMLFNLNRSNIAVVAKNSHLPNLKETSQIILTFMLCAFAWIFFRAENVSHALFYISAIFDVYSEKESLYINSIHIYLIAFLIFSEWTTRTKEHALKLENKSKLFRWLIYLGFIWVILYFSDKEQNFIYFQF